MKAALYVRKSTDDSSKNPDNRSTKRQIDHGRKFAEAKGWMVDEDHIFVDDNVSGANFTSRQGLLSMLSRLKEFDVIVMSELSRLGREQSETSKALATIHAKGVRVFFYLTNEEVNYESAIDKFMVQALAFAAEVEREKAGQRSRDALVRKVQNGFNAGGVVYGYSNIWVFNDGTRKPATSGAVKPTEASHTEFEINPDEADIVKNIYIMYADGHGLTTMAKTLNGDPKHTAKCKKYFNSQTPPSPRKGTGSWAPSSIRAILHNPRYEGLTVYGKSKKTYREGRPARVKQDEYLTIDTPKLRIVHKKLVKAVRERQAAVGTTYIRDTNGNLWGRPGMGRESRYLLTGMARCSCCGSNITLLGGNSGPPGKRRNVYAYGCSYHKNHGSTVCSNDTKGDMKELDNRVLDAIENQIFVPGALEYYVDKAVELVMAHQQENPKRPAQIERELKKLRKELDRFMTLIATGSAPDSVLTQISQREARIQVLETELAALQLRAPSDLDHKRLGRAARARLDRFKDLLHSDVPLARQGLRKLLAEPMQFEPVMEDGKKTYKIRGVTKIGALLDPDYITMASPRGRHPIPQIQIASEIVVIR